MKLKAAMYVSSK
uniref:Uncharacterized protein n=1 Tax=Lepeophtheirus salmonis TaxID=72036 RepID=A0A0K2V1N2_LEPSM